MTDLSITVILFAIIIIIGTNGKTFRPTRPTRPTQTTRQPYDSWPPDPIRPLTITDNHDPLGMHKAHVKMDLYIGIQTNPKSKDMHRIFSAILRPMGQSYFQIEENKTRFCVFMYDVQNVQKPKCAINYADYYNMFNELINETIPSVASTTKDILTEIKKSVEATANTSTLKSLYIVTTNETGAGSNEATDDWIKLATDLRQLGVLVSVVPATYDSWMLVENPTGVKQTLFIVNNTVHDKMFVLPEELIELANNEKENVFHLDKVHDMFKRTLDSYKCHMYSPFCGYADVQQSKCEADWERARTNSSSECPNNPGRGTPLWEPVGDCRNETRCKKFCDVFSWTSCEGFCGKPMIKPTSFGFWYSGKNCPQPGYCPPCTTTTPTTTTTKSTTTTKVNTPFTTTTTKPVEKSWTNGESTPAQDKVNEPTSTTLIDPPTTTTDGQNGVHIQPLVPVFLVVVWLVVLASHSGYEKGH